MRENERALETALIKYIRAGRRERLIRQLDFQFPWASRATIEDTVDAGLADAASGSMHARAVPAIDAYLRTAAMRQLYRIRTRMGSPSSPLPTDGICEVA